MGKDIIDVEKMIDKLPSDCDYSKFMDLMDSFEMVFGTDLSEDEKHIEAFTKIERDGGMLTYVFDLEGKFEFIYLSQVDESDK